MLAPANYETCTCAAHLHVFWLQLVIKDYRIESFRELDKFSELTKQ
jgi:hypothetical protein